MLYAILVTSVVALTGVSAVDVQPRQTAEQGATMTGSCTEQRVSAWAMIPPIPSAINTGTLEAAAELEVCTYTPPASIASQWTSYTNEYKSWASENNDMLEHVASVCRGSGIPDLRTCDSTATGSASQAGVTGTTATLRSGTAPAASASTKTDDGSAASSLSVALGALLVVGLGFIGAL